MNNLLILTTRYNHKDDPIGATFIYDQVEELRQSFDKILVIAYRPYTPKIFSFLYGPDRKRDSLAKDYSYKNVEVKYVKNFVIPFSIFRHKWAGNAFNSTRKFLRNNPFKADIIHAHRTWPIGEIAFLLSKYLNIEYLITVHGYDAYGLYLKSKFYKKKIKIALTHAKKVISVSKKNIEILSSGLGLPPEKFKFISNGFDEKKFYLKNKKKTKKIIFLSIGFLHKVKGHIKLIEAFSKVHKLNKNIELKIIGDGPEKNNLIDSINNNNLDDFIKLIGSVPHNQIPKWINSCDYFVLPSLNEGMPTVMFEALSCGIPVIATKVGGIPEIINDDIGVLVSCNNSNSLAKGMLKAMNKKWDNQYISNYVKEYSWQNITKKLLNIYKS